MTVESIKDQLQNSQNPVAKSFHTGDHFKVLIFGFNRGMTLEEHAASLPTKLLVMEGEVIYKANQSNIRMRQFDEVEIEPDMPHSLEAVTNSVVLLTQG